MYILTAVNIIKKRYIALCSEKTKSAWPPTTEQTSTSERNIPESVYLLLTQLLKLEKHSVSRSENMTKAVESYAVDLVHGVSREEIIRSKRFQTLSVVIRNPQHHRFVWSNYLIINCDKP